MSVSARLAAPTEQVNLSVRMQWDFYDPANPLNANVSAVVPPSAILYTEILMIDPGDTSVPKITARLTAIANRIALAQPIVSSLNTNVPSGTVVALA